MTTSINSNVPTRPLTVELTGNSLIDKETIAASLDTLPEFVSYTQGSSNVYILDDIINQHIKEENIDFQSLISTVRYFFPEIDELTVLKLWIARSNITDSNLLFYIQTEIGSLLDISTFMNYDSKDFLEVIQTKREQNKRKVLKRQSDKTSFGKGIPYTQIFPMSRTFKIVSNHIIPLEVIFDNYEPCSNIPFCTFNGMYKYAFEYSPESTIQSSENLILFKYEAGVEPRNIYVYNSDKATEMLITVLLDEDETEIYTQIISCIRTDIGEHTFQQTSIQAVLFFLGYKVDKYIFADFIMNTPVVSQQFTLGEFSSATKKTATTRIYMNNPGVTAIIGTKELQASGTDNKYIGNLISTGNTYTRIFITRAQSIEDINIFADQLSKILELYISKYDEIYKIYRKYIPTFESKSTLVTNLSVPEKSLLDPEIFLPNYSRMCPNIPVVSDPSSKSDNAIEFPKGSGIFYECKDDVYKYPGVRKNIISNSDKYPYVPCCFKVEQTTKPNFLKYYSEGIVEQAEQIRMITTDKPLNPRFFGILPESINNLLTSLNIEKAYARHGVSVTTDSFIDCISLAIDSKVTRESILKNVNLTLCLQENPGMTLYDIKLMIENKNVYFDPRRYLRLIEHLININIYLFDSNGISLPYHVHGYYKYKNNIRRSILIYEHRDIRRCELIASWDTDTEEYEYIHEFSSETMDNILYESFPMWVSGKKIYSIKPEPITEKCISQYVDMYGKVRGMLVQDENMNGPVYIKTPPLPTLNVPLTHKNHVNNNTDVIYISRYLPKEFHVFSNVYSGKDKYEESIHNWRIAKFLSNSIIYLYSVWVNDTGNTDIAEFFRQKTVVQPSYTYNKVGADTEFISQYLDSENKLIVPSTTSLEHLVFVLTHTLSNNPQKVLNYYKNKYFKDYYNSIGSYRRGRFILSLELYTGSLPEHVHFVPQIGQDGYIISLDNKLYRTNFTDDSYFNDSTVYMFNSPGNIVKRGQGRRKILVYKYRDIVYYLLLTEIK